MSAELFFGGKAKWKPLDFGSSGQDDDAKMFDDFLKALDDAELHNTYAYFQESSSTFAELNPDSANFFATWKPGYKVELLQDKPKNLRSVFDELSSNELFNLLNCASAIGAVEVCRVLVEEYNVVPTTDTATVAFLAPESNVAKYYIEKLMIGPKLSVASNLCAIHLNEELLGYLDETYGSERLSQTDSNILATAAMHPDQNRALEFIRQALAIFTATTLSLLSAFEANNNAAFDMMLKASPDLALTAIPVLETVAQTSPKTESANQMISLLNYYAEAGVENNEENKSESSTNPTLGIQR